MSNEDILKEIVDSAPAESEAAQDAIDGIDEQVAELTEKQNALKFQMDSLKTDMEDAVDSTAVMGPHLYFTYADYYTGSLLSIDDNIEEWQSFYRKSSSVNYTSATQFYISGNAEKVKFSGTGLDDMTADSTGYIENEIIHYKILIDSTGTPDTMKWSDSGGIEWNETGVVLTGIFQELNKNVRIHFNTTTGHTLDDSWEFWVIPVGCQVYFDGTDQTTARVSGTVSTVIYDGFIQTDITMNMGTDSIPSDLTEVLHYIIEPGGVGWNSDPDINDKQAMIDEFEFANQYIHTPVGLDGTYGTKDMIATLGIAKGVQQNNKANADDTPDNLSRYAST